jgi:hypothetical protein
MASILTTTTSKTETQTQDHAPRSAGLNAFAAACAWGCVLVALTDIALSFLPLGMYEPGTLSAVEWFALFQQSWFFGMRNLGLLPNIPTQLLMLPLFLAIHAAQRGQARAYAALALAILVVGAGVYLSNNAAFPMLDLSARYAAASTEAERVAIAAAGEAVLVRGEDFTPASFPGFVLGEIAMLMISGAMLRGGVFSRATGLMGIAGALLLTLSTVWLTFFPAGSQAAMLAAMLGGLAAVAWYILTARQLLQLGRL